MPTQKWERNSTCVHNASVTYEANMRTSANMNMELFGITHQQQSDIITVIQEVSARKQLGILCFII
jgi:hypothetical protein